MAALEGIRGSCYCITRKKFKIQRKSTTSLCSLFMDNYYWALVTAKTISRPQGYRVEQDGQNSWQNIPFSHHEEKIILLSAYFSQNRGQKNNFSANGKLSRVFVGSEINASLFSPNFHLTGWLTDTLATESVILTSAPQTSLEGL